MNGSPRLRNEPDLRNELDLRDQPGLPLAEFLRGRAGAVWATLLDHPFPAEMAAGTLPPAKFRFYIDQNLLYLPEYARVLAAGATVARDDAELRRFSSALVNITDTEIPQNERLRAAIARLGAGPSAHHDVLAPAAQAYVAYLAMVAARFGPAEIFAAILPCAWSYGQIGRRLSPSAVDHPVYADWLRFWSTDEATAYEAELIAHANTLDDRPDQPDRERLATIFLTAARFERAFWDMAYHTEHWADLA
ncbi:thiaminase (transcriptional activator TenA) [Parafrankia irregularis]|uniref:Aminopyrimidine aminohydrolase n=1 Tax=Parafrankia irregularis TaxID=795642 RepID=A0A0S4QJW9_9ACTN|nr:MULTISPECIES: thiaminase II [Parafrankia]MBE3202117.1 thiaminase II [Parafrankia sp. CH37]CUU55899.1 thiaminase (transcriptional activator TenA) [Parafrankia irregularis]